MNYRDLFQTIKILISSPAKAWEEISLEQDRQRVFASFVYPMIGLCAFAVFIGSLITNGWGDALSYQLAMTDCCEVAVSLFGGCFLSAYAINELRVRMLHGPNDIVLARQFAGYAMVVTFLIHTVTGIFPDLIVIGWMIQFYVFYLVWEGVPIMFGVDENNRFRFTIFTSLLLLVCPAFIQFVFGRLTSLLN